MSTKESDLILDARKELRKYQRILNSKKETEKSLKRYRRRLENLKDEVGEKDILQYMKKPRLEALNSTIKDITKYL